MHPYLPHLLEDIENAKRPGYSEDQPFYGNFESIENDTSALDKMDGKKDVDDLNPSFSFFNSEDDEDEDMPYDLAEHFAEVERYVSEDPQHSFGYYCGLKVSDFPPAEQLSVEDTKIIIKAFEKMSITWNIDYSIPDALPLHQRYKIIINSLSEPAMITTYGFVTFDYCSGSPDECIFGEYCNCLKYWQEEDSEKNQE